MCKLAALPNTPCAWASAAGCRCYRGMSSGCRSRDPRSTLTQMLLKSPRARLWTSSSTVPPTVVLQSSRSAALLLRKPLPERGGWKKAPCSRCGKGDQRWLQRCQFDQSGREPRMCDQYLTAAFFLESQAKFHTRHKKSRCRKDKKKMFAFFSGLDSKRLLIPFVFVFHFKLRMFQREFFFTPI